MISYLCRTYQQGRAGNFRCEPFTNRAAAEACAREQSRRGFFSRIFSAGHTLNGQPLPDLYLCEYVAEQHAGFWDESDQNPYLFTGDELERTVQAAGIGCGVAT